MAKNSVRTSKKVATKASEIMKSSKSKDARIVGASALVNRKKKTK